MREFGWGAGARAGPPAESGRGFRRLRRVPRRGRGRWRAAAPARCRAGRRRRPVGGAGGPGGTRTRRDGAGNACSAGRGTRPWPGAFRFGNTRWTHAGTSWAGRPATTLRSRGFPGRPGWPTPAVGDHPRARRDGPGDEAAERPGSVVPDRPGPDAARPAALRELDRPGHGDTPRGAAAPAGGALRAFRILRAAAVRGRVRTPRPPPRSPEGGSAQGRPWPGEACAAAATLTCSSRCPAGPGAGARRCRWSAWPRDARRGTMS